MFAEFFRVVFKRVGSFSLIDRFSKTLAAFELVSAAPVCGHFAHVPSENVRCRTRYACRVSHNNARCDVAGSNTRVLYQPLCRLVGNSFCGGLFCQTASVSCTCICYAAEAACRYKFRHKRQRVCRECACAVHEAKFVSILALCIVVGNHIVEHGLFCLRELRGIAAVLFEFLACRVKRCCINKSRNTE